MPASEWASRGSSTLRTWNSTSSPQTSALPASASRATAAFRMEREQKGSDVPSL